MNIEFKTREDGLYRSICRGCHGGCGALLTVRDGKVVDVRPDQDNPFNQGRMCVKGMATAEIMYHPDRLLFPLRRVGERGGDRWERVSWDTALTEIAARLDAIRKESGVEAIAIGQGTGRHHYLHVIRFANTLGTPNWYEPGCANCFIPRISVSNLTYGGFVSGDYYGETPPRTILFWGSNPLVSGPDGKLSFPVERALNKGSFGIAVDPRRSETAKRCGLWLPIRPGTDAALALAMIHQIIYAGWYDADFVERWTTGFDVLRNHVREMTPMWGETITGVPASAIIEAARRYAMDRPSVLEWGVSLEQNANSLQTVRAVAILRGLTGNLDVPGSDILGMNILRPYPVMKEALPPGMLQKRIGADEFKLLGGFRAFMPSAHIPGVLRAMRTGEPYRIRALLNFGSNPLLTVADTRNVYDSLQKLDLLVVTDLFMTPTAALADYVLPAALWPEVNQIVEMPYVVENAVLAQQKVAQVGECRQDEDIMIDLARRLGLPGSEEDLEGILGQRLEPLGVGFEGLKERYGIFPPHRYRKFEDKGFRTPSRKVELYCKALERLGYDPLPSFKPTRGSASGISGNAKDYPYMLTTGARRRHFFHSEGRQIKSLRRRQPEPIVEMHPDTALRHEIQDGDWVRVSSPCGSVRMKARITADMLKDVISVDHGWWFPERGGAEYGLWESNANVLTSSAPPYDPAFGSYQLRGLACNVCKSQ